MQPPTNVQLQQFYQNNLIQKLSSLPQWTISDNQKRPLAITSALQTNFLHPKFFKYGRQGALLPLPEFDQKVPIEIFNRNLRLEMPVTKIIALDIEPQYNHEKWDKWLAWMPFDYIEYSMHNGFHILIDIPETLLKDPDVSKILNENNEIQELEEGKSHQGIEFLFSNHFLTLTRRILTDPEKWPFKPLTPKDENEKAKWLKASLIHLNKMHNKGKPSKKVNTEQLQDLNEKDLKAVKKISKLITPSEIKHAKLTAESKTKKSDGSPDLSLVEWTFLCSLHGYYKQLIKNNMFIIALAPQLNATSKEIIQLLKNDKIEAYVLTDIAQKNLQPREKWGTKREGLPWLLSNSIKVIQYLKTNDKQNK